MRNRKRKKKITIIPVSESRLSDYLFDEVMKILGVATETVNKYGMNYVHETPWSDEFLWNAKTISDAVYGIGIGAIGRINTCEHAVRLGLQPKVNATTKCFTSMALYNVFRVARLIRKEYIYVGKLEDWINNWMSEVVVNSRRLEYEGVRGG